MPKRTGANIVILVLSVFIALLISEALVRHFGESDENGQFYFMDRPLKPYKLQVAKTTELIDAYLKSTSSYTVYDPYLGWSIRPNAVSNDGLYRSNSAGLRSDVEYDLSPRPGVVRIALFGDSFTHGSDQPIENTWAYLLEQLLREQGIDAEVLNFGVGGYGTDQAFLRWQSVGREYSPDIVLFGFRVENIKRNLNVIRSIYTPKTGNPFSKPRFVLEGETLTLVNSPTIPPEKMPNLVANFADSPLAEYEYFFEKDDYTEHWWLNSRLLAFGLALMDESREEEDKGQSGEEFFNPESEAVRLAIAIMEAFQADVEAHGAQFVVVHLPAKGYLSNVRSGKPSPYADLMQVLDERFPVVHTEEGMMELPVADYFGKHYSPEGYRAVATVVAQEIYERVSSPE